MPTDYGFGQRPDLSLKGPGFAQSITPEGDYITEFSAGESPWLYPLVYEGISPQHMETVRQLATGQPVPNPLMPEDLNATALLVAMRRAQAGLSPFWTEGVDPAPRVPVMGNFDIWY